MERHTIKAPAKINLFLHVNGRREDGYHLLDSLTVFSDDVTDVLSIAPADNFSFDVSGIFSAGLESDNLVTKAVRLMEDATGETLRAHIHLEKNIPVGAGLGGGSSDAAAVVKLVEEIWGKPLETKTRDAILLKLGADVPVCYVGKPCRFQGVGDMISDVPPLPSFHMAMVWPNVHAATKDVFSAREQIYREAVVAILPSFNDLSAFMEFLKTTGNDLSDAAEKMYPDIRTAREAMEKTHGCLLARMSGSGSSVFGIFETKELCSAAKESISGQYPQWWAHTSAIAGN